MGSEFLFMDDNACPHRANIVDECLQSVDIMREDESNRRHHCVGKSNPADKLTRGMSAKALVKGEIWIKGPAWLLEPNIPYNNLRK
ncbi:hypothetical protein TNCV_175581 [Trichonephila clavipes]|nr:hypothetical protein TNCV_175581 [Trichonephila clavipes]